MVVNVGWAERAGVGVGGDGGEDGECDESWSFIVIVFIRG